MGIVRRGIPLCAALSVLFVLAGGCAPTGETVRQEGPDAAGRPPPGEEIDLRLLSASPLKRPLPPYSVTDESVGRWLTLFEVTFRPVAPGNLPETAPGEN